MAAVAEAFERRTDRGVYVRSARCPTHGHTTTRFRGVQSDGWVFHCIRGPHNFIAIPPGKILAKGEHKPHRQGRPRKAAS